MAFHPPGPQAAPGWYPDPGAPVMRWWDGQNWTSHTQPLQNQAPVPEWQPVGAARSRTGTRVGIIGAVVVLVIAALVAVSIFALNDDSETTASDDRPPVADNGLPLAGDPWAQSQQVDLIEIGDPPEFPASLDQWSLTQSWDVTQRAFENQETPIPGPDFSTFPATMNGCDNQRFLVRWRVLNPNATVVASLADANGTAVNNATGSSGRMDSDGCLTPQFEFAESSDASNLTDIAVSVQRWSPAP
ncbi:DUF2510 domain-containing protein [Williamsia soli]|uniref:DUF2510 domain-containing protein n=1 Tax=Williamsia soli TaxID=364929 RepID=UPI001A9E5DDC|nr:DUF2510 domain-containing protein [Williamsia soli]